MRTHTHLALLSLCGLLLLTGGVTWAQDGGLTGGVEESDVSSPKEMLQFSKTALAEMDAAARTVDKNLDVAEKDSDEDKKACLRSKLASIKALGEVSKRAGDSLAEALANDNNELAEHEFRKIAVALSKVRQFLAEAEACLGEAGAAPGKVTVDWTSADSDDDDETDGPAYAEYVGTDAPKASPFE